MIPIPLIEFKKMIKVKRQKPEDLRKDSEASYRQAPFCYLPLRHWQRILCRKDKKWQKELAQCQQAHHA